MARQQPRTERHSRGQHHVSVQGCCSCGRSTFSHEVSQRRCHAAPGCEAVACDADCLAFHIEEAHPNVAGRWTDG